MRKRIDAGMGRVVRKRVDAGMGRSEEEGRCRDG